MVKVTWSTYKKIFDLLLGIPFLVGWIAVDSFFELCNMYRDRLLFKWTDDVSMGKNESYSSNSKKIFAITLLNGVLITIIVVRTIRIRLFTHKTLFRKFT